MIGRADRPRSAVRRRYGAVGNRRLSRAEPVLWRVTVFADASWSLCRCEYDAPPRPLAIGARPGAVAAARMTYLGNGIPRAPDSCACRLAFAYRAIYIASYAKVFAAAVAAAAAVQVTG
jgi:hypothetical protein